MTKIYYVFDGSAGDEITVDIDAETIGSMMDPVLYLYNDAQELLAEMDDDAYYLDPNLTFTLPETGAYYLDGARV